MAALILCMVSVLAAVAWKVVERRRLRVLAFYALAGRPAAPVVVPKTLRLGDTGPVVELWQRYMRADGDCCVQINGVFDGPTFAATCSYQHKHQLANDGIVGPMTWRLSMDDGTLWKVRDRFFGCS